MKKKTLTPKQKKIASKAGNPTKIDAADFKALKKKKSNASQKNKI